MFGSRRPGKRSIVGSRVCARQADGFFRPAVIKSIAPGGPWQDGDRYTVEFQDGSTKTGLRPNEVVGAGFLPLTADLLLSGQPVFITNNGREVRGVIVERRAGSPPIAGDELSVLLGGEGPAGTAVVVQRRVDDIRLIESRRSARLSESQQDPLELQYQSVTMNEFSGKRRSREVDVPSKHLGYKYSHGIDHHMNGDVRLSAYDNDVDMESETMDEHMAALVLTSLSCSPTSPVFANGAADCRAFQSEGSSSASSGVWTMKSNISSSPSPPKSLLSQSAPATVTDYAMWQHCREKSPSSESMGIEVARSRKTVYRCTWPGCDIVCDSCPLIERHVREEHLSRNHSENGSLSDESDHEEEFYYTEVEEAGDDDSSTMHSFVDARTSSPSLMSEFTFPVPANQAMTSNATLDHDYQRKEYRSKPLGIPRSSSFHSNETSSPMAIPVVTEVQAKSSLSWQPGGQWNRYVVDSSSFSFGRSDTSSVLSPTTAKARKSRNSDVRKCRKVYGIENRSLWCTQCKWKKACTRFFDRHDVN